MDNKKYIIVEIIPTAVNPRKGDIVQLSALKLNGYKLEDRFDYRMEYKRINNKDLVEMISYDKDNFEYVDTTRKILMRFKKWIEDYDLLIIDNKYTTNWLKRYKNKKKSVFKYLNMEFSDDVIDKMIKKYKLKPSNHIVDLLYEALIMESNNKLSR